jgi:site-specific DNA recombinase
LESVKTHELALDQRLQLLDVKSFTDEIGQNVNQLDIRAKKKMLRLLVKEVVVGDDIIEIKHSIPLKEGINDQNDKNYQLCKRSDRPAVVEPVSALCIRRMDAQEVCRHSL